MTQPITAARPARRAWPGQEAAGRAGPATETVGRARPASPVPVGARPSAARAAAAARLVGAGRAIDGAGAGDTLPIEHRWRVAGLRHLWVVPDPSRSPVQRGRTARVLFLGGVGLLMAVAFGLVYLHVVLAQRQFALDRLTAKVQADSATYQRLRLQVAQLGSPQHVISTAEGQLGMRQPASVTYLTPTVTIPGLASTTATPGASQSRGQAPAGDADWPRIKSQLAGSP